jgi:hypothetical protein
LHLPQGMPAASGGDTGEDHEQAPQRRDADQPPMQILGWIACLALAASLTYMFVRTLASPRESVDPLFFGLQSTASLFFLIYSIRLRNRVFITANAIALANALGTLAVQMLRQS